MFRLGFYIETFSLFKKDARAQNTRDNNTLSSRKEVTAISEERAPRILRTPLYYPLPRASSFSSVSSGHFYYTRSKRLGSCRVLRLRVVVPWSLDNARARERNAREERYERALSKRIQNALWCTRFEWNNRVDHERKRLSYFFLGICSLRCWSHFISSART